MSIEEPIGPEAVPDAADDEVVDQRSLDRRRWEEREHLAELEARLAEAGEREHVRHLELEAMRRELLVRAAYVAELERTLAETRAALVDHQEQVARLWARIVDDAAAGAVAIDAAGAARVDLEARLGEVSDLLAAERARASHRLVEQVIARLRRHPRRFALLQRIGRRWTRRS